MVALVSLTNVSKNYPPAKRGGKRVIAIDDVSLDIEAGDVYGIIGYSGAGKSTLVRLINALEATSSGSIRIDGREITDLPERQLQGIRLGIGMIFQQFNLFNSKTVAGNIAYPLRVAKVDRREIPGRVDDLLRFVGLSDKARNYPEQLSGGQKQRVGIARALAASPSILLADEATSALDPETTGEVLTLLKRVNRELGVTIVVITHEMDVIQSIATKVAVMDGGRIVERGDVFDIFSDPQQESSKRFVSTVVQGVPSAEEIRVLRARHPGHIVTFSFRDGDVSQALIYSTLAQSGVSFEIVYGGINDIQGRVFGHLTLALAGEPAAIGDALQSIRGSITVTEAAL